MFSLIFLGILKYHLSLYKNHLKLSSYTILEPNYGFERFSNGIVHFRTSANNSDQNKNNICQECKLVCEDLYAMAF